MHSRALVLHYGLDELLSEARVTVLEDAGYEVLSADSPASALRALRANRVSLVIACHSVPPDELESLVRQMRQYKPKVPILVVHVGGLIKPQRALVDACVDGLRGPQHLLSQVASWAGRTTHLAAS
jgi:DNA-binding response OmpR family regulator